MMEHYHIAISYFISSKIDLLLSKKFFLIILNVSDVNHRDYFTIFLLIILKYQIYIVKISLNFSMDMEMYVSKIPYFIFQFIFYLKLLQCGRYIFTHINLIFFLISIFTKIYYSIRTLFPDYCCLFWKICRCNYVFILDILLCIIHIYFKTADPIMILFLLISLRKIGQIYFF